MSNDDNVKNAENAKEEQEKQQIQATSDQEVITGYGGCLVTIIIISFFIWVLSLGNSSENSQQPAEDTSKPVQTISIDNFKKYEQQIYDIPQQCDADYNRAMDALAKNDAVGAYEQFDNAHYSCLDCFSQFSSLKLPEGLSAEQKDILKDANRDFSIAYKSKSSASKNFKKGIDKNSVESMAKAKENLELFQTYLFRGAGKLTEVKTQIEEQNKKTD